MGVLVKMKEDEESIPLSPSTFFCLEFDGHTDGHTCALRCNKGYLD